MTNKYDASSIQALKPLAALRLRPGMYVGSIDIMGIETILREVIDNSIDELINGHGSHIEVEVNSEETLYRVRDYGRGIPVDTHKETGQSALFVLCSHVHSGGKFSSDSYKTSGGLNGVGIKATNALSEYFRITSFRDGKSHTLEFQAGELISDGLIVEKLPKSRLKETGTEVIFSPDPDIFTETDTTVLSQKDILEFIKSRSFLSSNTALDDKGKPIVASFNVNYDGEEHKVSNPKGIIDFVTYNMGKVKPIFKEPVFMSEEFEDTKTNSKSDESIENVKVQVALTFANEYKSNQRFFCNTIEQKDGGRHVTGFKHGLLSAVKNYIANAQGFREKDREIKINSDDCLESCFAVVSLFHSNPIYRGQDKSMLTNTNAQTYTNKIISDKLPLWFEANPKVAKVICDNIIASARARDKSKALKEGAKNNDLMSMSSFGKLSDCSSSDRAECEVFICEGKHNCSL